MYVLKHLRLFLIIENILFVFRNVTFGGKIKKILMYSLMITEMLICASNSFICDYLELFHDLSDVIYFHLALGNSLFCVFLACYYSGRFKQLLLSIAGSRYHLFKHTKIYFFLQILFTVNELICDIRFHFEFFFLYSLLYTISEQLECIIRSVAKDRSITYDHMDVNASETTEKILNEIKKWCLAYTNVAESSKCFNSVFSVQRIYETRTMIWYGIKVSMLQIHIFMVSRAAQRIHNNVDSLRQSLGKLFILSFPNEQCYYAIRDFLRFVSYHQIRIQAFGSITVDMTLPPTCIVLFTSYTVIALQFSNVM
ncbi:uncharacterized protein [Battus philenor]|uniref:uncharacterized protein n=1 Tax=Battus philenor TaxID=42288 RepID=UPI0035D11B0E